MLDGFYPPNKTVKKTGVNILSHILRVLFSLVFTIFSACVYALDQKQLNEMDLSWSVSSIKVSVAFISGNEQSNGMYIYRVRFPKGHKIMPHHHSDERVVTIISGSLYVGYGNTFDASKMKKLVSGGLWTEPKNRAHFVWAKDSEVELQVVGYGPSIRTSVSGEE